MWYSQGGLYLFRGVLNLRESGTTLATDATARDIRVAIMASTTTAGPAGTANGGTNAEDITALSGFTTFGEYNGAASYVPGFAGGGRKALANQTVTANFTSNHRSQFDFDDLLWTALAASSVGTGAKGLLFFFQPGTAASDTDNIPLIWIDTVASGTAFPWQGSGGDVSYVMPANGLGQIGDKNLAVFA